MFIIDVVGYNKNENKDAEINRYNYITRLWFR